jgi:REP element-mobilizing transposase RayT
MRKARRSELHRVLRDKYQYRRRLPHYQKSDWPLFVSFRKGTKDPLPDDCRDLVLQCCLRGDNYRFHLHAAVIMPEHVHLLLTPLRDTNGEMFCLSDILKGIKGASARSVNKLLQTCGPLWQEESFDHVVRSNESLAQKIEYIRQNPVRRGLVTTPEQYQWLWIQRV